MAANLDKMRETGRKAMMSFAPTRSAKIEASVTHGGPTDQTEATKSTAKHNLPVHESSLLIPGSVPVVGQPATRPLAADTTTVVELTNSHAKPP